jgi:tetratricopeptide (TPR) repeat protein
MQAMDGIAAGGRLGSVATVFNRESSPKNARASFLAGCAISLSALAVYANSFSCPFLFDDASSVADNPTIRHLWPLWVPLVPPHHHLGLTVEGRPLLNLSLAVNYAISGTDVWSYHALNLAIHVMAGLLLFGIVRRTLDLLNRPAAPILPAEGACVSAANSTLLAFAVALLWTVHPLQTESVTYIIQRAESLMGLFYILTIYCFIRSVDDADGRDRQASGAGWSVLCFVACLLGMASKEVMASAPLMVLLYDYTFVAGSLREAWRRRRRLYLGLASTWLVVVYLTLWNGNRGGTAGFGINVGPWTYALTQFQAISHYLWLSIWPRTLIFDYGTQWVRQASDVVPYALFIGALVAITVIGLRRRSPIGFLGAWIFAILAPTSSIIPGNRQTLAEHRMYLPLAAVIALVVCGGYALLEQIRRAPTVVADHPKSTAGPSAGTGTASRSVVSGLIVLFALAAGLGALTVRRNEVYRSQLSLFRDSVIKRPDNAFARYNLGKALDESGAKLEAIEQYQEAIRLDPTKSQAHDNLGNTLGDLGRWPEAIGQYESALRINPNNATAHDNLGRCLLRMGHKEEARDQFNDVVLLRPDDVEARDNLGGVLLELGHIPEAVQQLQAALRINSGRFETYYMLGNAYLLQGRARDAVVQFEQALRLNPDLADARARLAIARREADEN